VPHSSIAKNSIYNILGQIAPIALGIIVTPFVVNQLGPIQFGIYSFAWIILSYFAIIDFGLGIATTRFISQKIHKEDHSSTIIKTLWSVIFTQLFLGVVGLVILKMSAVSIIEGLFNIDEEFRNKAIKCISNVSYCLPFLLLTNTVVGYFSAIKRFDIINIGKITFNSLVIITPAIGIIINLDIPYIILLISVIKFLESITFFIILSKYINILKNVSFSRNIMLNLFKYGKWIGITSIFLPIAQYAERLIIANQLSASDLTYYSVPYELISKTVIIPQALSATLFPVFTGLFMDDRNKVYEVLKKSLNILFPIMFLGLILLYMNSFIILRVWIGSDFAEKTDSLFKILTLTFFFHAFSFIPLSVINSYGRPDFKTKSDFILVPIMLILCFYGVNRFGLEGIAVSKLIITIADCAVLNFVALHYILKINPKKVFPKMFIGAFLIILCGILISINVSNEFLLLISSLILVFIFFKITDLTLYNILRSGIINFLYKLKN
jgi:O-antigen/teichoic acid export membrane protein